MEGVLGNEDDVRASVSKYYGEQYGHDWSTPAQASKAFSKRHSILVVCHVRPESFSVQLHQCIAAPHHQQTLQTSSDLKTSACCTAKAPPKEVLEVLKQLPHEIIAKYYGCGSPFPRGLKGSGLRVLDLGCGSGRDCYVCAALVGEKGLVTGIDMTPAQLAVAQKHSAAWQQQLGYAQPNMRFIQGSIEELDSAGIAPSSIDLAISNCVINLSPNKAAVLQQVHRALADGGEMYFSDVYCDRRLPAELRTHEVLLGECLGGALAVDDFVQLAQQAGFSDPRVLEAEVIEVHDTDLKALLGDAQFYSITFRLFKLPSSLAIPPSAVTAPPNKIVSYYGNIPGAADSYELDYQHTFNKGVPVLVSAATAAICSSSWLAANFSVSDSNSCCAPKPQKQITSTPVSTSSVAALATKSTSSSKSCCAAPAPAAAAPNSSGSCCAPPPPPAAAAAAPNGSSNGCCLPAQQTSSCCPAGASNSGGAGGGAVDAGTGNGGGKSCCGPSQKRCC